VHYQVKYRYGVTQKPTGQSFKDSSAYHALWRFHMKDDRHQHILFRDPSKRQGCPEKVWDDAGQALRREKDIAPNRIGNAHVCAST
jgi:hypothetical protein